MPLAALIEDSQLDKSWAARELMEKEINKYKKLILSVGKDPYIKIDDGNQPAGHNPHAHWNAYQSASIVFADFYVGLALVDGRNKWYFDVNLLKAGKPFGFRRWVGSKLAYRWLRWWLLSSEKDFAELEKTLPEDTTLLWSSPELRVRHIRDTDAVIVLQPLKRPPVLIRKLTGERVAGTTPNGFVEALQKAVANGRIQAKGQKS